MEHPPEQDALLDALQAAQKYRAHQDDETGDHAEEGHEAQDEGGSRQDVLSYFHHQGHVDGGDVGVFLHDFTLQACGLFGVLGASEARQDLSPGMAGIRRGWVSGRRGRRDRDGHGEALPAGAAGGGRALRRAVAFAFIAMVLGTCSEPIEFRDWTTEVPEGTRIIFVLSEIN